MKTKYFTVLILMLLLTSCVQERLEPLSDQMKHQLAMLPQDVDVIGYINLQQIQQSAVLKVIADSAGPCFFHNKEVDEFKAATGFDFQKDVNDIYFAVVLNNKDKGLNGLVVANGNYDPEKIITFINSKDENKKVVEETYAQFKILTLPEEHTVFCFADQHTFVGGKAAAVKTWLDKSVQSSELKLSANWLQAIETLKYKNGLWLAMTTKNLTELMDQEIHLPKNFQGIKNIKSGSFSMNFSDYLSFYGQGECIDPEKAVLFRDAFRGFLASAKLAVSSERDLVDIINKVNIESKNEKVTVQFKLKTEEIEKLKQMKKTSWGSI